MTINGYLVRDDRVVWRDIAGEVVIAERDNSKIRTLNKVASLIWSLSDGTRQMDDIITAICDKFEISWAQAQADSDEFCRLLLAEDLIKLQDAPVNEQEV
jgi:hypothetical protein